MGVVHRAFDTRLERPVAIKLLHPSTEFDSSRRLLNEARAACALNHPNICTVHEVAEHGDHSFIVMEFIDGRPLSDVIAEGSPPAPLALSMALQIAGALSHAHDRRIVHGDLKTANVLVLEGSRVKVVDFGLARRHQGGTEGLTQSSFSGGTPYTSAPEQLRGAPADTRSDVWALGVLLQELTSGTRPFWRPNLAELLAAILTESPTAVPSHVNPALRRIIERCLARDPASRYQSAGEVLAALDAVAGSTDYAGSGRGCGLDAASAARSDGGGIKPDRDDWARGGVAAAPRRLGAFGDRPPPAGAHRGRAGNRKNPARDGVRAFDCC